MQRAFEEEQVHQCGYCMTGQMLTAVALLRSGLSAADTAIMATAVGACNVEAADALLSLIHISEPTRPY